MKTDEGEMLIFEISVALTMDSEGRMVHGVAIETGGNDEGVPNLVMMLGALEMAKGTVAAIAAGETDD